MNLLTSCLFYFSNKKGVDFILKNFDDVIPIE